MEERALGFRDFYVDDESSESKSSVDSDEKSNDSWDYSGKKKKRTRRETYSTHVLKAMEKEFKPIISSEPGTPGIQPSRPLSSSRKSKDFIIKAKP